MERQTGVLVPGLEPGDICVFSHGNGAIYLGYGDGRSRLATLSEVLTIAQDCYSGGCRVFAGWEDTAIARVVIDQIRSLGVTIIGYTVSESPHSWSEGTNALMEAATVHSDAILDDLIERGVDVNSRDQARCTALHHAARADNAHAIDALVAAGAELDAINLLGFSPYTLALAYGRNEAAEQLADRGASTDLTPRAVPFGAVHGRVMYSWMAAWALAGVIAAGLVWSPGGWDTLVAVVVFAAYGAATSRGAWWTGGAPRCLDGTSLTLRGTRGNRRAVDLTEVRFAALGGPIRRPVVGTYGWLLLEHPEGRHLGRSTLHRLGVADGEVDSLERQDRRIIGVLVDWKHRNDVLVPVGNLLAISRVPLLGSFHSRLEDAWASPDQD